MGKKKVTKVWKVAGEYYNGVQHPIKESYEPSYKFDFSDEDDTRIIEVMCSDITGTNDFCVVRITCNTEEECYEEMEGQRADGIFGNQHTNLPEEIDGTEYENIVVPDYED